MIPGQIYKRRIYNGNIANYAEDRFIILYYNYDILMIGVYNLIDKNIHSTSVIKVTGQVDLWWLGELVT